MTIQHAPPNLLERTGRNIFRRLMARVAHGSVTVRDFDGSVTAYGSPDTGRAVEMTVTDPAFYRRLLLDGDIGVGEAYMYGQWTSPDLTALIAFFIENRDTLGDGETGTSALSRLIGWINHRRRSNTRSMSRRNISAHYDLSNDFFGLFLDHSMLYSSGYFRNPDDTLEQSQINKMDMLIERAGIEAGHHVLEIGSGWGGFAIHAARRTGCRVTSVTISREQFELARARVQEAGLEDRITIEFRDYRDITGSYDRVVSIEMLEAVGHEHFPSFFRTVDRVLKPGGRAALQVITIPDLRYEAYRKSVDWIRVHIFPGGHLPSIAALEKAMSESSGLRITESEDIGIHYARTLEIWRENLAARRADLERMGFDDIFFNTWMYYFSYCEAAFATRALGNHHLVLER